MTNQNRRPAEGERYNPKYPQDYPASRSGLQPLPFYPNLKRELRSVTGALVLTYLEIYYPPSQDASGALLRAPVTIHLDRISEHLQISRRTLFTVLCVLAARWESEEARARAARAGREFLNPAHSVNGRVKLTRSQAPLAIFLTLLSTCTETSRSSLPYSKRPESHRSRNRSLSA